MTAAGSPVELAASAAPAVAALLLVFSAAAAVVVRPPVTQRLVLGAMPWFLAAGVIQALVSAGVYPPLAPAGGVALAPLVPLALGTLAWAVLASDPDRVSRAAAYLALVGCGQLMVLLATSLVQFGTVSLTWLSVAATVATGTAFVVVLCFGLWVPDAAAHAAIGGGLATFAAVLDGVAAVGASRVEPLVAESATALAGLAGDAQVAAAWLAVWWRLAVAVLVTVVVARRVRRHPEAVGAVFLVLVGVGTTVATGVLLAP